MADEPEWLSAEHLEGLNERIADLIIEAAEDQSLEEELVELFRRNLIEQI